MSEIRESYEAFVTYSTDSSTIEEAKPLDVVEEDGKRMLTGYAVVWDAVSDLRKDGFRHTFGKGVIQWRKPTNALWSHTLHSPIGTTRNNSLRVTEDDYGARVEIDLPDTSTGRDVYALVRDGYVGGMSFGGVRPVDAVAPTDDPKVRRITQFAADEVTVTISPAMVATSIAVDGSAAAKRLQELATRKAKAQLDAIRLRLFKPADVAGGRSK